MEPTLTHSIRYLVGDVTRPEGTGIRFIAHVCNDLGAWGAGFTRALSERWEQPQAAYLEHAARAEIRLGTVHAVPVEPTITVVNMIAQHGLPRRGAPPPIRYDALRLCLAAVRELAGDGARSTVHMPRIGCGLAGGRWEVVEPIILEELVARGVLVTVYDLR